MVKVAIIQALYHGDDPDLFRKSLEAIRKQAGVDWTLFLGVDGPVGEALSKVIHDECECDDKIVLLRSEVNKGLAQTLNAILRRVLILDFDYIARMDSDDLMRQDRLFIQSRWLDARRDVDVVGSWILENTGTDLRIVRYPVRHDKIRSEYYYRNPLAHPSVMIRRRFFYMTGLYPSRPGILNEDYLLWMRGLACGVRMENVPLTLITMTANDNMLRRRRKWATVRVTLHQQYVQFRSYCRYDRAAMALAIAAVKMMPISMVRIAYRIRALI